MTRGETKEVLWGIGGRGLVAAVIAAITIASALWLGASWNSGASPESASWNSGSAGDASWVSGSGADSPYDLAVATSGSGAAPEQAVAQGSTP